MVDAPVLHSTRCAICEPGTGSTELYPANFELDAFNPAVFSARRLPDRVHYRIVRCDACGLVRSDPVADEELLSQLYRESSFDYGEELAGLRNTYSRYLQRVIQLRGGAAGDYLEIGCGNGFMLEEAQKLGFKRVRGIEPSSKAIGQAREDIRPNIVCDVARAGVLEGEQFDAIAMFQVFDHISSPRDVLAEVKRLLKPGGYLMCLNHNVDAFSARVLGERSPIIDIEHTYLYGPRTLSRLLEQQGLVFCKVGGVLNSYSLFYLARLMPFPGSIKRALLGLLNALHFRKLRMTVPWENMYVIAQMPELMGMESQKPSMNPNVEVFHRDALSNAGYLYTTNTQMSSQLATQRTTDTILSLGEFKGSRYSIWMRRWLLHHSVLGPG